MSYAKIGLFEGFDSNFPTSFPVPVFNFHMGVPPPPPQKKKKKRGLYNQRQALGSFLRFRYVRVTWDICDAWPASCTARDQRLSALPFTLFALVQDLHAMAVRKVALPVDESAHSEQACDCKY